MPPKKNDGSATKYEKSKQTSPPQANVSHNDGRLTESPPHWFKSEMEKILSNNEAIEHRVKSIEEKQHKFIESLSITQQELDDYKKTERAN